MKNLKCKMRGSAAITMVLIVSAVLIIFVVGMSNVNISTSSQQYNFDADKWSYYVAEGCLEESIKRLEDDINFTSTSINADSDTVCSVNVVGNLLKTISIDVNYLEFSKSFEASVNLVQNGEVYNAHLSNWSEI
ncbi:hypothetical protein COU74_00555 [Candidatus Peregrinibacteria bacterium CG10_big_fil_rev_8_21_14_0_10_36_19]|nr:MAG: hypothetical protein COU74_00555 [Candidatus Peregrinibacteria bacterium CG10_big_fil_rev_8_21_14_0_10_36_19]